MMFIAQMGLGLLANMVAQSGNNINSQQNQTALANLRKTLNESAHMATRQVNHPWDQKTAFQPFEVEAPPFPDEAAKNLSNLQQNNSAERTAFMDETKDTLKDMKEDFFASNHLETAEQKTPDGQKKLQVALDNQGKPQVKPGPENPEQRVAREEHETTTKTQLDEKHDTQKDNFVKQERENVQNFLANNKPDLGNPAVQAELQKMIMQSHKKALGLTKQQQEETLKSDLYSMEQIEVADAKLSTLREMEDQHAQMEDDSPDAQELYNHQQDLAELLRQKRDEAQRTKLEEAFLKGPPRFSASTDKEVDVAEVLPPYLSNALYNMGIYSV